MRSHLTQLLRDRRGAAMVEFAMVATLFVFLLVGIAWGGVMVNAKIVLSGAAREAGRTWAIDRNDAQARQKAADAIAGGGLKFRFEGKVLFDPHRDVTFDRQGDYIYVTVIYRQPTFAPIIADIVDRATPGDGLLTLQSQAVFRVER